VTHSFHALLVCGLVLCLLLTVTSPAYARQFGLNKHTFELDGLKRSYLSYVPKHIKGLKNKHPLVIVLHGGGGTHRSMLRLTKHRFNRLADEHSFIVIYPNAIEKTWDFGEGHVSEQLELRRNDLEYFRIIIQQMESNHPIDFNRIFATGISRGGQASYFLACKLPGRIRAIAPFTMPLPDFLEDDCSEGPPVSMALFNGTADPLVPYTGGMIQIGKRARGKVLSTDQTLAIWRRRNGCSPQQPKSVQIDQVQDGTSVDRFSWNGCADGQVILYRINNGGHTWPSGPQYLPKKIIGRVTRDIDGATEAWRFFRQF